mgnify:CR=1 FL=1
MDWRFPGYFFPHMYRKSALAMKEQGYAQVRELMSNYGEKAVSHHLSLSSISVVCAYAATIAAGASPRLWIAFVSKRHIIGS